MLINTCSDFDSNMDDLDEFEDSKIQKGTQANLDSVPSSSASKLWGYEVMGSNPVEASE